MSEGLVIGESALHAYFDGELDEDEAQDVEAWLQENPGAVRELEAWLEQKKELKLFYDPVLQEPISKDIKRTLSRARPARRGTVASRILALFLLLAVAAVWTWFVLKTP